MVNSTNVLKNKKCTLSCLSIKLIDHDNPHYMLKPTFRSFCVVVYDTGIKS